MARPFKLSDITHFPGLRKIPAIKALQPDSKRNMALQKEMNKTLRKNHRGS